MALIKVSKQQLKTLKAVDFKENDLVDVLDKNSEVIYQINIHFGEYKRPLRTFVTDKNGRFLNCTAGTKGGWPYYIANFIHAE